ncbi:DUF3575 domain-containing protein [Tenacibaculum sp. IB213877]|uniref:DUF3575 domain-containing protein n=1 Tax=Tenacibaculum sp. IB213877 TaxID=3097351 RepID=UPI002A599837|nr:DUF3575 domain-containing protein [Tenacibaculum sp. IB213877]MDY0780341.1 DUF3575 domain-containing protein [Tenacibaculum sp. IB213877]
MKKIIIFLVLAISINAFSQEQEKTSETNNHRANELKLNGLYIVAGAIEVTYERLLNEETGIGISAMVPLSEDIKDELQYYISPYFRKYFGSKYAAGFFVEAFGMLNSADRNDFLSSTDEFVTDFALGIGVGGKWVTKGGFIAELNLGFGRNLFNSNQDYNNTVGKAGITVGYQF